MHWVLVKSDQNLKGLGRDFWGLLLSVCYSVISFPTPHPNSITRFLFISFYYHLFHFFISLPLLYLSSTSLYLFHFSILSLIKLKPSLFLFLIIFCKLFYDVFLVLAVISFLCKFSFIFLNRISLPLLFLLPMFLYFLAVFLLLLVALLVRCSQHHYIVNIVIHLKCSRILTMLLSVLSSFISTDGGFVWWILFRILLW